MPSLPSSPPLPKTVFSRVPVTPHCQWSIFDPHPVSIGKLTISFPPSCPPSLHPTLPPSIPPKTHLPEYNVLLMLLLPWLLLLTSLAGPSSLAPPLGLGYQDCSRFSTSSPSIQLHIHLQPHSFKYYLCAHGSQF